RGRRVRPKKLPSNVVRGRKYGIPVFTCQRTAHSRRPVGFPSGATTLTPGAYFTAKTQIEPPCGTSGYLPGKRRFMRDCILEGSTPQPDWTAMYCLPSTEKETGTAATPEPVGNSQRILPVLASKERNLRSLVPPENSTPPPVASTGPQLNEGSLVVHARLPV